VKWCTALRDQTPLIDPLGVCGPALCESTDVLLRLRIRGLGRDPSGDTDAMLDDLAVAELGEALGGEQHALDRFLAPRAEQGREIGLAGLRDGGPPETCPRPEYPIGIGGRDHALPVAALQRGRVRFAPLSLGCGEIAPRQSLLDLEEPSLPSDLDLGSDRVVGKPVEDGRRQQHRSERRGDRWERKANPAEISRKTFAYWTASCGIDRSTGQELNTVLTGE